jgi:hypothetical protein
MEHLNRRLPTSAHSVGSLVKKILAIYPDLGSHEIIQVIRQSTKTRSVSLGDSASAEYVDEQLAIELTHSLVKRLKS